MRVRLICLEIEKPFTLTSSLQVVPNQLERTMTDRDTAGPATLNRL